MPHTLIWPQLDTHSPLRTRQRSPAHELSSPHLTAWVVPPLAPPSSFKSRHPCPSLIPASISAGRLSSLLPSRSTCLCSHCAEVLPRREAQIPCQSLHPRHRRLFAELLSRSCRYTGAYTRVAFLLRRQRCPGRRPMAPPDVEEETLLEGMGVYGGAVRAVGSASAETLLLWALLQPTSQCQNAFVHQATQSLTLDACGRRLSLLQSTSTMGTPGVTGVVVWDSGVVLAKFLEHTVDSDHLVLHGTRAVELGAGCGVVECVVALLGAHVVLTDIPDQLRLLRKNVRLIWGRRCSGVSPGG